MDTRKTLIETVFPALRQRGLIARANYTCCGSCASYALGVALSENPKRSGAVYWHRQDDENLRERNGAHLGFGAGDGKSDEAVVAIGELVRAACVAAGLTVEWDGSVLHRIWVEAGR